MIISFRCIKCSTCLSAPETLRGQAIRCPKCQTVMRVPLKPPSPITPAAPPPAPSVNLPSKPTVSNPALRSQPLFTRRMGLIALAAASVLLLVCGGMGLTGVVWLTRDKPTPPPERTASAPAPNPVDAPPAPPDNPAPKPPPPETEQDKVEPKEADPALGDLPPLPPLPKELPVATAPLAIAQAPSLDKLMADARHFAAAIGKKEQLEEGLTQLLKTISPEGARGIDRSKPLGCYFRLSEDTRSGLLVVLVPIGSEASFRRLLRDWGFQEQDALGDLVPFKVPRDPRTTAALPVQVQLPDQLLIRFAQGYAHICLGGDPNLMRGDKLLAPASMFVRRDKLLSVTLRLDRLPMAWREIAVAKIKGVKNTVPLEGGPAVQQYGGKFVDFLVGHLEDLIHQGRNLSFDLGLDAKKESLAADLYLQGAQGSRLARGLASLVDAPSAFGSWPLGDAALAVQINVRLPAELRSGLPALVEEATRKALAEVTDPRELQKHGRVLRAAGEVFAAGELDGMVLLRGQGEGQAGTVLGGLKVPNGKALEQLVRDWLKEPENKELRPIFEMDVEQFDTVKAHRINAQANFLADQRGMFGENPLYLAFRPNAVLWAGGTEVKKSLPQAIRAGPGAAPLVRVVGEVRRLSQLVSFQPGGAALTQEVFDARHPGRFRLELSGGEALRLHVGIDLALFRFAVTRLLRFQP